MKKSAHLGNRVEGNDFGNDRNLVTLLKSPNSLCLSGSSFERRVPVSNFFNFTNFSNAVISLVIVVAN